VSLEMVEETAVEVVDPSVLGVLESANLDVQITTAKKFPRSITKFTAEVMNMVKLEGVASECVYALPRKDKDGKPVAIEGPSARLAEIVFTAWGNCRAGARVIEETDRYVVAQGIFQDVERNTFISYEVRRSITGRKGRRYSEDMIGVTANAACSIALRNAVFKGIPKAIWNEAYVAARAMIAGDEKTLNARRTEAMAYLQKLGATEPAVFATLGVAGIADIGFEEIVTLRGYVHAIREGESTVESIFPEPGAPEPVSEGPRGTEGLMTRLAGAAATPGGSGQPSPTSEPEKPSPAPPQARSSGK
jgi:hypothetical protein